MDMIERVAKAIWDDACPGMTWGDIDRLTYRGWAEAAIRAMREPTDHMLNTGDSYMPLFADGQGTVTGFDALKDAWPMMIDAALEIEQRA